MNPRVLPQVSSQSLQLSSEASEIERILLLYVHEESRTWRLALRALSFAQTSPDRLNVIHGQHVTRPPRMSFILNALLILARHARPNDASRRTTRFGSSILAEL